MSEWTGKFCWYELMTSDLPAARKFYGDVIGWTGQNAGQPHMDYWLMSLGEAMAAGLMAIPAPSQAGSAISPSTMSMPWPRK